MPSRGNQKDQVLPNREVPYRGVHTAESEPDSTAKQRNRSGSEVSDSTVESEVESRQSPRNLHVSELSAFSRAVHTAESEPDSRSNRRNRSGSISLIRRTMFRLRS
jgi:hypothetical protein